MDLDQNQSKIMPGRSSLFANTDPVFIIADLRFWRILGTPPVSFANADPEFLLSPPPPLKPGSIPQNRRLRRILLGFPQHFLKEIPQNRRLRRILLGFPSYFLKGIPQNRLLRRTLLGFPWYFLKEIPNLIKIPASAWPPRGRQFLY